MLGITTSTLKRLILATVMLGGSPLAPFTSAAAREADHARPQEQRAAARLVVASNVPAMSGATVAVSLTFAPNGNEVSSLVFSLDIDEHWLSIDTTDADQNGVPDAVTFNLPRGLRGSAAFNAADTDGELDVLLYDTIPPLAILVSGTVMTVTFSAGSPPTATLAAVAFSADPAPSAGSNAGQTVALEATGGGVMIQGTGVLATPTPTLVPSNTATPSHTATPAETITMTPTIAAPSETTTPAIEQSPTPATGTQTPTLTPALSPTPVPSATRTATTAATPSARRRIYLPHVKRWRGG